VLLDLPQVAYKPNNHREIDHDRSRTGMSYANRPVATNALVRVDVSWIVSQAMVVQQLGACRHCMFPASQPSILDSLLMRITASRQFVFPSAELSVA
jgi:hypothetical protein